MGLLVGEPSFSAISTLPCEKTAPFPNDHRSPQADAALLAGISSAISSYAPCSDSCLSPTDNNKSTTSLSV